MPKPYAAVRGSEQRVAGLYCCVMILIPILNIIGMAVRQLLFGRRKKLGPRYMHGASTRYVMIGYAACVVDVSSVCVRAPGMRDYHAAGPGRYSGT